MLRIIMLLIVGSSAFADEHTLEYAPAPVDNPYKGLVPYQADVVKRFAHSMEFNELPLSELMTGYDNFDWKPLEKLFDDVASRGHQTVFRIVLEYPDRTNQIPQFLIDDGLKVHKWLNTNTQPEPPAPVETPDYEDANLRRALKNFIIALGKKYDGDPRIAYINAGLLGTWGEWHTYPREDLWASKSVQKEVLDSYEMAFKITPILVRYPAGKDHWDQTPNANRPFGYHDDSFAWATLDTGKKKDDWFYMTVLKDAKALDKWKTQPIGGEIRPEAWKHVFEAKPKNKQVQNFRECVDATHVSWLMDSGLFERKPSPELVERATIEVRRMGYEFHVAAVTIGPFSDNALSVALILENRGNAPIYYDMKPEFGLVDASGKVVATSPGVGKLTGLLPGDPPRVWDESLQFKNINAREYTLAVRVPNPMPKGHPLKFANKTQDADAEGWLSLGSVTK